MSLQTQHESCAQVPELPEVEANTGRAWVSATIGRVTLRNESCGTKMAMRA
jgi:hypothetical protein